MTYYIIILIDLFINCSIPDLTSVWSEIVLDVPLPVLLPEIVPMFYPFSYGLAYAHSFKMSLTGDQIQILYSYHKQVTPAFILKALH